MLITCAAISLIGCDQFGTTRVKNIIDLTPKLEIENRRENFVVEKIDKPVTLEAKVKAYKLARQNIISAPCVAKGVMYTLDSKGKVNAFSLESKKSLWSVATALKKDGKDNFTEGAIACSNGKLYVVNGTRSLIVLDAKTGIELVRKDFVDVLRQKPAIYQNIVIVQTISNNLFAYDVENAKIIWGNENGIVATSSATQMSPVIYNDSVLVSYSSGELMLIDVKNGNVKWSMELLASYDAVNANLDGAFVVGSPVIDDSYFYVATSHGKVIKIHSDNGSIIWSKPIDDIQSMSGNDNALFVTTNGRQVAALSKKNGHVLWVGALISEKERKQRKVKPVLFQAPFLQKMGNKSIVSVIGSNGEMYNFAQDGKNMMPSVPIVAKVTAGVNYQWISCCSGTLHLIAKNNLHF